MSLWRLEGAQFGLPAGVLGAATRCGAGEPLGLDPTTKLLAAGMGPARRAEFVAGRTCARSVLARLGRTEPVLMCPDGAPLWPAGVRGSISHKDGLAVALAGTVDVVAAVGVDLELAAPLPPAAWRAVLTPGELSALAQGSRHAELCARVAFSAKESYYKWFRATGAERPVDFHDLAVECQGGVLRYRSQVVGRFPEPRGMWVRMGGWLMTMAWSPAVHGPLWDTEPRPPRAL